VAVEGFTPEEVPFVGGRRFWVSREAMSGEDANSAFAELEAQSDQAGDGPLGICLIAGPEATADRPEAVWPEDQLLFAGFDGRGNQIRIRYFDDAAVGPAHEHALTTQQMRDLTITLEDRYRVLPLSEAEGVTNEDVIAFWEREGAVSGEEAHKRVHEVQLVGIERDQGIAAVSTAYLGLPDRLGMHVWYYRGFVGREHRQKSIATNFAMLGRDHLEERFTNGVDTRGQAIVFEIENEFLKTFLNKGQWLPSDFTFIGENDRGDHVRIHYFAGAEVQASPAPPPEGTQ
jgi:hypothetical protein